MVKDELRHHRALLLESAIRANTQLSTALRGQGRTDAGDMLGYRAKILETRRSRVSGSMPDGPGLNVLNILAGYGFRPLRGLVAYALVVVTFGVLYWLLGAYGLADAIVASVNASQGRGVSVDAAGDLSTAVEYVGAAEAVAVLAVEVVLVATFTQRFLSR
jgi:hypothetical protein